MRINLVFLELFRKRLTLNYELFYYKKKTEVDFVLYSNRKVIELIQVTLSLSDTKTRNREIRALLVAAKELNPLKISIITINKIGNSQGLIIPKKMLKSFGENTKFDMQLKDSGLFVVPLAEDTSRKNWEKKFAGSIKKGYVPINEVNEFANDFDKEEWTW